MKQKGKIWADATGRDVATYAINPVLRIEEKHSHRIASAALRVEKALKNLNDVMLEGYTEVYEAKVKDAEIKNNKKPTQGMTINSFDETIEIKITKPNSMYFDNDYTEMVKNKFDEYFASLNAANDTAVFLKEIVGDLLMTSGGRLDSSKVLKLRKYRERIAKNKKIKNAKLFIAAVDLFDKAIRTKKGNTGIYVSVAENVGDKRRKVALKIQDI